MLLGALWIVHLFARTTQTFLCSATRSGNCIFSFLSLCIKFSFRKRCYNSFWMLVFQVVTLPFLLTFLYYTYYVFLLYIIPHAYWCAVLIFADEQVFSIMFLLNVGCFLLSISFSMFFKHEWSSVGLSGWRLQPRKPCIEAWELLRWSLWAFLILSSLMLCSVDLFYLRPRRWLLGRTLRYIKESGLIWSFSFSIVSV